MSRPITPASERPHAAYLGDGVYANIQNGGILLTSENGIEVQNEIFLEPSVFESLKNYVKKYDNKTEAR
jgi:hypothetical protein